MHQSRLDLSSPAFRRAARGFDPDEVRAFLELFAPDYEAAYADLDRLRASLASLGREVDQLRDAHRSLVRVLAAAEEGAQVHAAGARRDAERILAGAEAEAAALVATHEQQRRELEAEIEDIHRRRRHAREALEGVIEQLKIAPGPADLREPSVSEPVAPAAPSLPAVAIVPHPTVSPAVDALPLLADDPSPATANEEETLRSDASWTDTWALPTTDEPTLAAPALSGNDPCVPATEPGLVVETADPWPDLLADSPEPRRRRASWVAAGAAIAGVACIAVLAWPRVDVAESSAAPRPVEEQVQTAVPPMVQAGAQGDALDPLVVKLSAARPCWIRLVVDGKAETRVLAQGEELVRGAARYVELRAGDAAALAVEVNGSRLPPLGRTGQVVDQRFEVGAVIE
jgi:cell division initiation protein